MTVAQTKFSPRTCNFFHLSPQARSKKKKATSEKRTPLSTVKNRPNQNLDIQQFRLDASRQMHTEFKKKPSRTQKKKHPRESSRQSSIYRKQIKALSRCGSAHTEMIGGGAGRGRASFKARAINIWRRPHQ